MAAEINNFISSNTNYQRSKSEQNQAKSEINPELREFLNKNAYKYEPNKHQETYENKTGKYIFNAGGYSFIVMSPQGEVFIFKKQSVYGSAKEGSLFHKMKNQFGIEPI